MKILYDHQAFEMQNFGGVSRYFAELIKSNPDSLCSFKYSDNIYLQDKRFLQYNIFPKDYGFDNFIVPFNFKGKGRLLRYYRALTQNTGKALSSRSLKKGNFDIFHPTYYNPYFLQHLHNKPFVLTVYDMIHELFPQYTILEKETELNKKMLIQASTKIIVISEQTKRDLLHFYPEVQKKVELIYLGQSFPNNQYIAKKKNYILFTGMRGGYKNFDSFAMAAAPLLSKYNLDLVCTGGKFKEENLLLLNNLNIADRVIYKYASDEQLIELYSKAICFVFPSLYEGFGIPVLESFAANCPALLANTSSLPEVGGDAAVYFDPYSIDDMRTQIEKVICSPALQSEMIQKGRERLKQFSWEKCAKETMDIYKELM